MAPKRKIIPIFIPHAGCKNDCVFCDQRRITGAEMPVIENGYLKIANLESVSLPAELAFYGGSFTAIPIELQINLLEAAQSFLKSDPLNSIRISTRPDCLDDASINRLKYYGVTTVELGAQSMCDDVLLQSQRGHTASDVEHASMLIKNSGLKLILQMMTGLPGDTREKSIYTAECFVKLKPDGVRVYPTVVVRGTKLHELWERGVYKEHTVESAVELCSELCPIFDKAGIPIIRLGLNPSESLSAGDAVAGAYHPAFGELVYSRMYYYDAVKLLDGVAPGSSITIAVPPGRVSIMTGQHRCNIDALIKKFSLHSLKVVEYNLKSNTKLDLHINND